MANAKVLLVSDDLEIGQLWAYGLGQKGVDVLAAGSEEEALELWTMEALDLLIIDVCTPYLNGIELCQRLRTEVVNPILLLIYNYDELQALAAYHAGVDECIAKPISPSLFLAKVMVWLRRSWTVLAEALDELQIGELRLNPTRRQVIMADGSIVKLTNLEFRVLHLLMRHQGRVLETNVIVDRVWGYNGYGDSILLKNVVYRLRRKIETDPHQPSYLQTMGSKGYIFRLK